MGIFGLLSDVLSTGSFCPGLICNSTVPSPTWSLVGGAGAGAAPSPLLGLLLVGRDGGEGGE